MTNNETFRFVGLEHAVAWALDATLKEAEVKFGGELMNIPVFFELCYVRNEASAGDTRLAAEIIQERAEKLKEENTDYANFWKDLNNLLTISGNNEYQRTALNQLSDLAKKAFPDFMRLRYKKA